MSASEKKSSPKAASASTKAAASKVELQHKFDVANEQGYWGETPDETPNSAYTVKGVLERARKEKSK